MRGCAFQNGCVKDYLYVRLFAVHSRRSHGEDLGLLVEPERVMGRVHRVRRQQHASLADGQCQNLSHAP